MGEYYEYLIITPDEPAFIAWADTIRQWRTEQGIRTGVFTLSEIGGNDTTLIKSFIKEAYDSWDIPPVAVLLLADFAVKGDDSGIASPLYCDYIADNIYADMNGNTLPDLVISRITAQGEVHLQETISKMLDYERTPTADPDFYNHPVTVGAWQSDLWFLLCNEITRGYLHNVKGKDPFREYTLADGIPPDSLWSTNENTPAAVDYFGPKGLGYITANPDYITAWGGNAYSINRNINMGAFLVQYRGHGWELGWNLPGYGIGNLGGLSNDKYPYILSICCRTGRFDYATPCFAEAIHRMQNGALGILAASAPTYSLLNDTFVWGIYDYMWPDFDPGYGSEQGGSTNLQPAFASVGGKYYLEASSWPWSYYAKIVTYYFFLHHGDAFMRLYSETPQTLSVSHDSVVTAGKTSFVVDAEEGSWVGLSCEGEVIGKAAGGGPISILIQPLIAGQTLRVTVTKDNFYRYTADVPVVPDDDSLTYYQPDGVVLQPGFPNPFNPVTTISFTLPQPDYVNLAIYDIQGRIVDVLVDGMREARLHEVIWDASDLASGIYLYRLNAGDFTASGKMLLLK
jgi:hypothetical protein